MARGSRNEVTRYDRRRWLEQMEQGIGVTQIARSAARDIRVIKRHLDIAQQEAEVAQARTDLVRSRMELHQEDLLNETRRLHGIVVQTQFITLRSTDSLQARLNVALLEHLDRKPLKMLLDRYDRLVDEHRDFHASVTAQVETYEAKILQNFPSGIETHAWTEQVMRLFKDQARSTNPPERDYSRKMEANKIDAHVEYGPGLTLTRIPVGENECAQIVEAHKKLMAIAISHVDELRDIDDRNIALSERVIFELDSLLLRRMVPGRCDLCN